ncbi:MAG: hypothetical protein WBA99_02950 [Nodosilinea sp.]
MYQDTIVEEIHRIREEYSRSFNHNLKALFADLKKQQAESGRKVVNLSRMRGLATRWGGRMKDFGEDAKDIGRRST